MTAKKVIMLPRFGIFSEDSSDKELAKKMDKAGYEIMMELKASKIWVEK